MKTLLKAGCLALAMALVFGFVGCKDSEDDENAISGNKISYSWNADNARAYAKSLLDENDKNNEDEITKKVKTLYYRAFEGTAQKHLSSDVVITIENAKTLADDSINTETEKIAKARAGFGFLFGLEDVTSDVQTAKNGGKPIKVKVIKNGREKEETVKFYDCGIVSVRWNALAKSGAGQFEWYVNWAHGLPNTCFNYTDTGDFKDSLHVIGDDGEPASATTEFGSFECIQPKTNSWQEIDDVALTGNDLVVNIQVKTTADGYTVQLQKPNSDGTTFADVTGDTAKATIKTTSSNAYKTYDASTEHYIGRYITVYNRQSATGTIVFKNTVRSAVVEDEEFVNLGIDGIVVR